MQILAVHINGVLQTQIRLFLRPQFRAQVLNRRFHRTKLIAKHLFVLVDKRVQGRVLGLQVGHLCFGFGQKTAQKTGFFFKESLR